MFKGVWQHCVIGCEEPVKEEVAVKTMNDATSEEDVIKFLQEGVIMGQFDHPNVVKIMGIMATGSNVGTHCMYSDPPHYSGPLHTLYSTQCRVPFQY